MFSYKVFSYHHSLSYHRTCSLTIVTVLAGSKARLDIASPESVLCTAAAAGDLVQVKRLVEFGVDPNAGDYDRSSIPS